MTQDIHDWKTEHLHNEGWRIKGFLADVVEKTIYLATGGFRYHIHIYTVINVPAKDEVLSNGMNPSNWAFTPTVKCRCGHDLGPERIYNWGNDVNSLYPFQFQALGRALRYQANDTVIITARQSGKSYFAKQYMSQWTQDE